MDLGTPATDISNIAREHLDAASLFHGTAKAWADNALKPLTLRSTSRDNLYGPGLYMTKHRRVAESYIDKGPGQSPTVYGLAWKHKPKLIDLEKPFPKDTHAYLRSLQPLARSKSAKDVQTKSIEKRPGKEFIDSLRVHFANQYKNSPSAGYDEAQSDLLGFSQSLRELGYHGFSHIGGMITDSSVLHEVNIAFNPERDLRVVGHASLDAEQLTRLVRRNESYLKSRAVTKIPTPYDASITENLAEFKTERAVLQRARITANIERSKEVRASKGILGEVRSSARHGLRPKSKSAMGGMAWLEHDL